MGFGVARQGSGLIALQQRGCWDRSMKPCLTPAPGQKFPVGNTHSLEVIRIHLLCLGLDGQLLWPLSRSLRPFAPRMHRPPIMIPPLSDALAERGYTTLTPVQEAVSDPALIQSDLLVSAQTGSGKTVGFGIAIAPTLLGEDISFGPAAAPLALIVAPTRELAFQVKRELGWLYGQTGAVMASCVGGMDMRDERRALDRGAHIVVGTPGRLRDHIDRGSLDLSDIRVVVLDEADEMLDLGFREDLEFILAAAPEDRRTLLFSATVPPMIAKLAKQFQTDAQRINTITGTDQHADISYQAYRVAASDGEHAIFNLLRYHHDKGAIVFANTRAAVNHLTARLSNRGFSTVSLSGELSQSERSHALQAMRDGRARVCVATDVAARGIDLPNLNLVIHADLPSNTESLLHRSGRTGRAGRKGISALIVQPRAVKKAERLLKWAKITAEWGTPPSAEDILQADEERLLNDPLWADPISEREAEFGQKLLAMQSPEAVAAAYLRLFQSRQSAPEELRSPDAKPAAREKKDFGPSRWISLSVGRNDRAEARWLLPLLCRAGGVEKSDIGAIRVQDSETLVELTEASIDRFIGSLAPGGELEKGVAAKLLDGAPKLSSGPRGGPRPDKGRPPRPRQDREDRKPRRDESVHKAASSKPSSKPDRKPKAERKFDSGKDHRPSAPAGDKKPRSKDIPSAAPRDDKPRGKAKAVWQKDGPKPAGKPSGKPKGKPARPSGADARDVSKRMDFKGKGAGRAGKPGKPGKPGGKRTGGFDTPRRKK